MSARRNDFWSRRRAAVKAEEQAQQTAASTALAAEREAQFEERDDAELLAEAGLPDPEMLETSEEVRAFLRSALPQRLKTRALRKLWRMNPVLACLDGLNDYDDDFTDAACVRENLQTVYKVGIGMIDRVAEAAVPAPAEPLDTADDTVGQSDEPPETPAEDLQDDFPEAFEMAAAPEPPPAAPRRMRFDFET